VASTRDERTRGDGNVGTSSSNARREREVVAAPTHPHRLPDHSERGDDTRKSSSNTNWRGLPSKTGPIPRPSSARHACQPLLSPYIFLLLLLPQHTLAFVTSSSTYHTPTRGKAGAATVRVLQHIRAPRGA